MHMGTALVDAAPSEFAYMLSAASPDGGLGQSHDTAADGSSVMITTVTWTATDSSGKSFTCSLKVTITDDESPTLASGCGAATGGAAAAIGGPTGGFGWLRAW